MLTAQRYVFFTICELFSLLKNFNCGKIVLYTSIGATL